MQMKRSWGDDGHINLRPKRTKQCPGQPIPVPLASITGQAPSNFIWKCYQGRLVSSEKENNAGRHNYVLVSKKEFVEALYTHGYFGTIAFDGMDSEPEYKVAAWQPGLEFDAALKEKQDWKEDENNFWNIKEDDKHNLEGENLEIKSENEETKSEIEETKLKHEELKPENEEIKSENEETKSENEHDSETNRLKTETNESSDCDDFNNDDDTERRSTDPKLETKLEKDAGPQSWADVASFNQNVSLNNVCLHLELCEAFFLSYALGCLVVQSDERDEELTLIQMWRKYLKLEPDFPYRYAAYHSFRARGWVARSGYSMGCDWLLYKQGPPFYHASFTVLVESVSGETGKVEKKRGMAPQLTWAQMLGLNRLNENVNKSLLLVRIEEHGVQPQDFLSPHLLAKLAVTLRKYERWQPGEMRWDEKPQVPVERR